MSTSRSKLVVYANAFFLIRKPEIVFPTQTHSTLFSPRRSRGALARTTFALNFVVFRPDLWFTAPPQLWRHFRLSLPAVSPDLQSRRISLPFRTDGNTVFSIVSAICESQNFRTLAKFLVLKVCALKSALGSFISK